MIVYGREQRGTGAPTYAYRLSTDGEALFPNQYELALTRLIGHVVENEGRDAAIAVVDEQYADLRRQLGAIDKSTPFDRLKTVARVMEEAGFMAESSETDGEARLSIHNCVPRSSVGQFGSLRGKRVCAMVSTSSTLVNHLFTIG